MNNLLVFSIGLDATTVSRDAALCCSQYLCWLAVMEKNNSAAQLSGYIAEGIVFGCKKYYMSVRI